MVQADDKNQERAMNLLLSSMALLANPSKKSKAMQAII